tara:strand:- start:2071 stop:3018 length:948 start_codon:yes stop_codon:yes gene_type:complete
MIFKIKNKYLIYFYLILNLIFFSHAYGDIKIIHKINDEIITNIDIFDEYRYLVALNNDLKNIQKEEVLKIAEESIIREKIKLTEIKKILNFENFKENILIEKVVKNFYQKLGINNKENFIEYLRKFNVSLSEVEKKIEIEIAWNQVIMNKYKDQISVNEKDLINKIKQEKLNIKEILEYELSEIVFQAKDQNEFINKKKEIISNIRSLGFSATANKFSVSSTAQFGGKIGKIREDQLSEKILTELKKLKIGEFSETIKVANGFLILLIDKKNLIKPELNEKDLLNKMIEFEKQKQFEQFSQIYYNKIKLNSQINE